MNARVAIQLRVERGDKLSTLPGCHDVAVDLRQWFAG